MLPLDLELCSDVVLSPTPHNAVTTNEIEIRHKPPTRQVFERLAMGLGAGELRREVLMSKSCVTSEGGGMEKVGGMERQVR